MTRPFFLLLLPFCAQAATMPTVKFTPTVKIYECPVVFQHKSECLEHEQKLAPVKLWLDLEVLDQVMGRWVHQESAPMPASFFVIVMRGRSGQQLNYSISTETGLNGSATPLSNGRIEFRNNDAPKSFGVAGAPVEKNGKKYITELRLSDFHGRIEPTKK